MADCNARIPQQAQQPFDQLAHLGSPPIGVQKQKIKIGKWSKFTTTVSTQSNDGAGILCPRKKLAGITRPRRGAKGILHHYIEHKAPCPGSPLPGCTATVRDYQALILRLEEATQPLCG
jgi:hypothetical protein